ncbi:hypothetical protein J1F21_00135 [Aeromonas veronii]|uniref:hypothetical protein n=1 Tax=Aeromonas veronii TaxID=654 RepID=UPI001A8E0ED0|nr:hypothetical protein [Aeromonas veronii]MBO0396720.1 hypothetical protein [Aeromonas veronii]
MKGIKSEETLDELFDALDEAFGDDFSGIESPESIDRYAATLRKQNSVNKIVESGMKTIKLSVDSALYENLKVIYERAGFGYVDRGAGNSFKTADLSAALSYFLFVNSDDACFGDLFGYKAYLYSMYSIIQYRKREVGEGVKSVCEFLNKRKYTFFNKATYKIKDGDKWSEDNVKLFFESKSVSHVIFELAEKKRRKLRIRK